MSLKVKFGRFLRRLSLRFEEAGSAAVISRAANERIAEPVPKIVAPPAPKISPENSAKISKSAVSPMLKKIEPENSGDVDLPLKPVLEKLPRELRARLTVPLADLENASISISASQILPQLATGAVRIAFGQLRGAAENLFSVGDEFDSMSVSLPLDLVLTKLNRRFLARDATQKKIEMPPENENVFASSTAEIPPAKNLAATAAPALKFPSDSQIKLRMAAPTNGHPASPTTIRPKSVLPDTSPKPVAGEVPPPATAPFLPRREISPADFSPKIQPVVAEAGTILAPLAALAEKWPDALRLEIAQFNLGTAQVALPIGSVEAGLKRGIVTFFWHELRSRIRPTPLANASVHDGAVLELPLNVIAPIFFAQKKSSLRRTVAVDNSIPDLFLNGNAPKIETPKIVPPIVPELPAEKLKPVDAKIAETNFYVWGDTDDRPQMGADEFKRSPSATEFRRRAGAPNEIVTRAMALEGVAGALVTLHDGLMVACELPPEINPDSAAAFVPQLFERLLNCAGELKMGALTNLRFSAENVTWQIFRLNSAYFAAFSRDGENLPEMQLASLAGELDRNQN